MRFSVTHIPASLIAFVNEGLPFIRHLSVWDTQGTLAQGNQENSGSMGNSAVQVIL